MYDTHHKERYRLLPISVRHMTYDFDGRRKDGSFAKGDHPEKNAGAWSYCCYPNCHDTLEVLLITDGKITWSIEDREYALEPGDLVVVNPFVRHAGVMSYDDGKTAGFYEIAVDLGYFYGIADAGTVSALARVQSGVERFEERPSCEDAALIAPLIRRFYDVYTSDTGEGNGCRQLACLWELLGWLIERRSPAVYPAAEKKRFDFINRTERYIRENFRRDIGTAEISETLGYSVNHFCRLFRKNYGVSFLRYLRSWRVRRAAWIYSYHPGVPIMEIASEVGFRDYNYFSRAFKAETGMTPTDWFARRRGVTGQVPFRSD